MNADLRPEDHDYESRRRLNAALELPPSRAVMLTAEAHVRKICSTKYSAESFNKLVFFLMIITYLDILMQKAFPCRMLYNY